MRITQTFTHTDFNMTFESVAYSDDNGNTWRWVSNDAYCPLDACRDYGIPCNVAAQKAARDAEMTAVVREYRKRERNRKPTAEEMFEMRAAFGTGTTVVNVLTGRRTKL